MQTFSRGVASPLVKRVNKSIVAVIILSAMVLVYVLFFRHSNNATMLPSQVVTVTATPALLQTWQTRINAIGNLRATNEVYLTAQEAAVIRQVNFSSGQRVNAGDQLVLLASAVEEARLQQSQAAYDLAQINYKRDSALFAKKSISKSIFDASSSALAAAKAALEEKQALIARRTVIAPFSGQLGISYLLPGQYVTVGEKLVGLQDLSSLYVDFSVPEQYAADLHVDQVLIIKPLTDNAKAYQGKIYAINVNSDESTHMLRIQGIVDNQQAKLVPGLAAEVEVLLNGSQKVIVLPKQAIEYSLHGNTVYVIKPDPKNAKQLIANVQRVELGQEQGNQVVITAGLEPNQQVVTTGQVKLRHGSSVKIDNTQQLNNEQIG